ncbi:MULTISPECIES: PspA/IM30 family protein [unclassified Paenibacillus]|uniref:PspA/IM30 family protein n=1 Tax=unclassified Paenibacillus TaxID=185978 RepID=UPI0009550910|nr:MULTISPECIES: PspA/IM30 family protein [unclassified Paenibacillus]ASS67546.1 PspA/IM30 family protein [Paenibacillus sp. RUD330]SIQ73245.1 phage shock protein A (PspA) family protein [Paenibacillus sp. RU4X]SIQ94650.1 phage shock protein A (PspA) family protein [Paenibacillus sp. RU4T]
MGIFKRIKNTFLAETNGLLDRFEQPLHMVDQYIREFEQELAKGQSAYANQLFIEKRQAALIAETEAGLEKRDRQAKLAVTRGEEHIARLALQEKLLLEKKLSVYQAQQAAIQEQTKLLEERIGQLLVQSEEYSHRRLLLASRVNVAGSLKEMNQSVVAFQTENVAKGIARVEEKVLLMEAQAEAFAHFSSPAKRSAPQYLDPSLSADIDKALEDLKQQNER